MRTLRGIALTLGLAAVLSSPALAQRGGGGFGMGGGLWTNTGVQKELKLTPEQVEKVTAITTEMREKYGPQMRELFQQGEDGQAKIREISRTMTTEMNKALADVIKADQMKRYKEIELQQRGVNALLDEETGKALKVTEAQKTKLEEIQKNLTQSQRELFQEAGQGGDRQALMAKMTTLRTQAMEQASALLSDDQKKTWKEMTGTPYEVKFEARRPQQ